MKKLPVVISSLSLLFCSFLGSSAEDKPSNDKKAGSTIELTVSPKMSCQNCEKKIKSNLRFEKGVTRIATSLKDQRVTLTYDPSKTDSTRIIQGFKKIGYTATPYPKKL